jgi:hypothetical protein
MKPDDRVKNELYRKLENGYEPMGKSAPPIMKWAPLMTAACLLITAAVLIFPMIMDGGGLREPIDSGTANYPDSPDLSRFAGVIIHIYDNDALLIKTDEGEPYPHSTLITASIPSNSSYSAVLGDRVEVYFNGGLMETHPVQVRNIIDIVPLGGGAEAKTKQAFYVQPEADTAEEFYPSITLFEDGRFVMTVNLLAGMGYMDGVYKADGSVYNFVIAETDLDFVGFTGALRFNMILYKDNLIYSGEPIGMTETGSTFRQRHDIPHENPIPVTDYFPHLEGYALGAEHIWLTIPLYEYPGAYRSSQTPFDGYIQVELPLLGYDHPFFTYEGMFPFNARRYNESIQEAYYYGEITGDNVIDISHVMFYGFTGSGLSRDFTKLDSVQGHTVYRFHYVLNDFAKEEIANGSSVGEFYERLLEQRIYYYLIVYGENLISLSFEPWRADEMPDISREAEGAMFDEIVRHAVLNPMIEE